MAGVYSTLSGKQVMNQMSKINDWSFQDRGALETPELHLREGNEILWKARGEELANIDRMTPTEIARYYTDDWNTAWRESMFLEISKLPVMSKYPQVKERQWRNIKIVATDIQNEAMRATGRGDWILTAQRGTGPVHVKGPKHIGSNFYSGVIIDHGIILKTGEHWYQGRKAEHAGDYRAFENILRKSTPSEAKAEGRLIQWPSQEWQDSWESKKLLVMDCLMYIKRDQTRGFENFLRSTMNRVIKHPVRDANGFWGSLNLGRDEFGRCLMRSRKALRGEYPLATYPTPQGEAVIATHIAKSVLPKYDNIKLPAVRQPAQTDQVLAQQHRRHVQQQDTVTQGAQHRHQYTSNPPIHVGNSSSLGRQLNDAIQDPSTARNRSPPRNEQSPLPGHRDTSTYGGNSNSLARQLNAAIQGPGTARNRSPPRYKEATLPRHWNTTAKVWPGYNRSPPRYMNPHLNISPGPTTYQAANDENQQASPQNTPVNFQSTLDGAPPNFDRSPPRYMNMSPEWVISPPLTPNQVANVERQHTTPQQSVADASFDLFDTSSIEEEDTPPPPVAQLTVANLALHNQSYMPNHNWRDETRYRINETNTQIQPQRLMSQEERQDVDQHRNEQVDRFKPRPQAEKNITRPPRLLSQEEKQNEHQHRNEQVDRYKPRSQAEKNTARRPRGRSPVRQPSTANRKNRSRSKSVQRHETNDPQMTEKQEPPRKRIRNSRDDGSEGKWIECSSCNKWDMCYGLYGSMSSQQWAVRDYFCTGCDRKRLQDELTKQQVRNDKLEQATRELSERLSIIERNRQTQPPENRESREQGNRETTTREQHENDTRVQQGERDRRLNRHHAQHTEQDHGYVSRYQQKPDSRQNSVPQVQRGLVSFFGDSMIKYDKVRQGINAHLPRNMVAETHGRSGWTISQIRPYAVKELKNMSRKPEYTIIHGGVNDRLRNSTDDEIIQEVETTITAIQRVASESKCLWAGIIPVARKTRDYNRKIMDLNDRIKGRCTRHGWGYIDPAEFMHILSTTTRRQREVDEIYWDGLHLDVGGITVYARAVADALFSQGN